MGWGLDLSGAKIGEFFYAEDFSAGCKLLVFGGLWFWVELPVR